ncbi:DUF3991 domain-containing protein [Komagataeibacter rhaeticus]|nr:DUF3991 domain-containing protein [Komagataeibacter rhaeticus]
MALSDGDSWVARPYCRDCRTAGALKEGPHGTAWFGHRDADGQFTGMEMRGPDYKGFSTGGVGKRLFGFRADGEKSR